MRKPIDQTWNIERIAAEAAPRTWEAVFADAKPELHDVSTILDEQEKQYGQYYPLKQDIFAAFNYTPLSNVKLVIIGQDPYHQTININGQTLPRAVGLSFSVRQEDTIPSSLSNIYSELENTVRGFKRPNHGDLKEWARQGVLLLNTCLTVRPGQPGSHGDIWLGFVSKVFRAIAAVNPYCVYLLWGREAQKLKPMLGERSLILEAAHPSGLSAKRGFFGCNHFNLANDALIRQGKVGINWKISTTAELKNTTTDTKIETAILSPNNNHKPQLTPVDPTTLSNIIPVKATKAVITPSPHNQITGPLPIIPGVAGGKTSPGGQVIATPLGLAGINTPKTVQIPDPSPTTNVTPPIIPKISFGLNMPAAKASPTGLTGNPEILQRQLPINVPQILPAQNANQLKAPVKLVGLPLIPSIVQ